ncbi:MAG: OsmC family peroxiredoxin [Flavobacterium sp.]
MIHTAKAHWAGNFDKGNGTLTTQSNILNDTKYSFNTHFDGNEKCTNPEELLAAAQAGCFTMAISAMLSKKEIAVITLDTEATLTVENNEIKGIHLIIIGAISGINAEDFATITKEAEQYCMISKILNIPVTSEVHFATEENLR